MCSGISGGRTVVETLLATSAACGAWNEGFNDGARRDVTSYVSTTGSSDSHEHRLRLQPHAPQFFDALLDLIFHSQDFGGSAAATVDDCQRVLGGDANVTDAVPARESRVFDEPRSGYLAVA